MMSFAHSETTALSGTRDGAGSGDRDVPYRFGRRPRSAAPFPFTTRQFARLLILRGQFSAGRFDDDTAAALS
jgi:hypothetical protein